MKYESFDSAYNYVLRQREKAPVCSVCDVKLFDPFQCLDNYLYRNHHGMMMHQETISELYHAVYFKYPYYLKDKYLVRHHTSYVKNISIPVCSSCHSKIHTIDDEKYKKYRPVDKRPKDSHLLSKNVYKSIETDNKPCIRKLKFKDGE